MTQGQWVPKYLMTGPFGSRALALVADIDASILECVRCAIEKRTTLIQKPVNKTKSKK